MVRCNFRKVAHSLGEDPPFERRRARLVGLKRKVVRSFARRGKEFLHLSCHIVKLSRVDAVAYQSPEGWEFDSQLYLRSECRVYNNLGTCFRTPSLLPVSFPDPLRRWSK